MDKKTSLLGKLNLGIQAFKSAFGSNEQPNYVQLNDGTHTYGLETLGFLSAFGIGDSYFKTQQNFKWYYENIGFYGDCINLYADIASQVRIMEIDASGNVVENSDFVKLLDQPNEWQDGIAFIKEMVINTLCNGINVQYGDFFKNGNLKMNPSLYNIDFFNLSFPKIKNRYKLKRSDIQDLTFIEHLENGEKRYLKYYELAFIYDTISKQGNGNTGYDSSKFLDPISRVQGIVKDLQIMDNTADTMAFLSGKNVNWIISKKNNAGQLAPLSGGEKSQIETNLSGSGKYGTRRGKSDIIATNEDLQALNIQRDNRKMQMTEMQNNAKENIRVRHNIPRDLLDAFTGSNSGSTYENQTTAEARFALSSVKNITDSWLYSLESKNKTLFADKGHKLIGSYDHMASVSVVNDKLKNEGFKSKADALTSFLVAFEKSKSLGIELDYQTFLTDNGFTEFLKTQSID